MPYKKVNEVINKLCFFYFWSHFLEWQNVNMTINGDTLTVVLTPAHHTTSIMLRCSWNEMITQEVKLPTIRVPREFSLAYNSIDRYKDTYHKC